MEIHDIIMTLMSIITGMLGWYVSKMTSTIDGIQASLNLSQANLPKEYVLKSDHKSDVSEIKAMIIDQSKKIDQIWKHMRIDK